MSMTSDSFAKRTDTDLLLWFSDQASESLTSQNRIKSEERSGLQRMRFLECWKIFVKYSLVSKEDQKLFTVSGDLNPEYIKGQVSFLFSD